MNYKKSSLDLPATKNVPRQIQTSLNVFHKSQGQKPEVFCIQSTVNVQEVERPIHFPVEGEEEHDIHR